MQVMFPINYKQQIISECATNNLDPSFVASVICAESRFRESAVSGKGAVGLMQVMPSTAIWLAELYGDYDFVLDNLMLAEINIKYGCLYLRYLFEKFVEVSAVLASYNAGEGKVLGWLSDARYSSDGKTLSSTPYPSTNYYVEKVLENQKVYSRKF